MYTNICIYRYMYTNICIYLYSYLYSHSYLYSYLYSYLCIYLYIYIYICTYTERLYETVAIPSHRTGQKSWVPPCRWCNKMQPVIWDASARRRACPRCLGGWIPRLVYLVGGFNPSEKYDSQLGWLGTQDIKNKKSSKPPTRNTKCGMESMQRMRVYNVWGPGITGHSVHLKRF